MFKNYNYGPSVKVLCIKTEKPLPEAFVKRFSDNQPPVVWASECTVDALPGAKEKKTGKRAIVMSIESIVWNKGDEAEVNVEAYSDGLAANWNRLTVVYKGGIWVVKKDHPTGVS